MKRSWYSLPLIIPVVLLGVGVVAAAPIGRATLNGLTLPYAGVIASGARAFSITNTGTGGAGYFAVSGTGSGNAALQGVSASTQTSASGVRGVITSTAPGSASAALRGDNNSLTSLGYGVWGAHHGTGTGVFGWSLEGNGVVGKTNHDASGVYGVSLADGNGVVGRAPGKRAAVFGDNTGAGPGVYGQSKTGSGVYGLSLSQTRAGDQPGIYGQGDAEDGGQFQSMQNTGVLAQGGTFGGYLVGGTSAAVRAVGVGSSGVDASSTAKDQIGVYGHHDGPAYGVGVSGVIFGPGIAVSGQQYRAGNYGQLGTEDAGVRGIATSTNGIGVAGSSSTGDTPVGVFGTTSSTRPDAYAGSFHGNVRVVGMLTQSVAASTIDHPLDPANKYLSQAVVASSDMLSVYSGNVTTNANGEATVTLPAYIGALNHDFRYQLTVVGQFAQAIIAREFENGRFTIKTDKATVKVSWQLTGVRQDAYARAHPFQAESVKPQRERGTYLTPKENGQPESAGIDNELLRQLQAAPVAVPSAPNP